jgi:hypothetical protein
MAVRTLTWLGVCGMSTSSMIRALILSALLVTPALAGPELDWVCGPDQVPPPKYDGFPYMPVLFIEAPPDLVINDCIQNAEARETVRKHPTGYGGCTYFIPDHLGPGVDAWVIILRDDLNPDQRACVIRHELAHTVEVDGAYWRHDHWDPGLVAP